MSLFLAILILGIFVKLDNSGYGGFLAFLGFLVVVIGLLFF